MKPLCVLEFGVFLGEVYLGLVVSPFFHHCHIICTKYIQGAHTNVTGIK